MNRMMSFALIVAGTIASGVALAQPTQGTEAPSKAEASAPVYHAGGRHDQRGHEATLKARASGQKMAAAPTHAGGRHDVQNHEAAIRAEEKQSKTEGGK